MTDSYGTAPTTRHTSAILASMDGEQPTTAELLEAWREATRAAQLAERLASLAAEAADQADRNALASEQIATMAEKASRAAERAAAQARKAADQARDLATRNREGRLQDADAVVSETKSGEKLARELYHVAEREARERHEGDGR